MRPQTYIRASVFITSHQNIINLRTNKGLFALYNLCGFNTKIPLLIDVRDVCAGCRQFICSERRRVDCVRLNTGRLNENTSSGNAYFGKLDVFSGKQQLMWISRRDIVHHSGLTNEFPNPEGTRDYINYVGRSDRIVFLLL